MKIIFHKRPHNPWEKAICWWTGGPYFHCAMVFSDNILIESLPGKGVHMAIVENIDPAVWDTVEVRMTPEEEAAIQKWAAAEVGCAYDWLGIFMAQFLGIPRASQAGFFPTSWLRAVARLMSCSLRPDSGRSPASPIFFFETR